MTNASDKNNPLDLSALDFGPSWARGKDASKKPARREKSFDSKGGKPRKFSDKGNKRPFNKGRSERPAPRQRAVAPEGIKASIMPVEEGIDNLVKEITDSGRTYSVFDLARVILKSRERFNISFAVEKEVDLELFQAKADQATYLTKEEALAHFAGSELFSTLFTTEQVEAEAPKGNFPSVAVCGFTGQVIAPPNFHGYQAKIEEIYNAEFTNMSLDRYKGKIQIVKEEEKIAEWTESMKSLTHYKLATDEAVKFETKAAAIEYFAAELFAEHYITSKRVFVSSQIAFKILTPGLATALLETISEQVRYPGELSSFLCRQLSGRHLAVFKWQGKLHAGPSRPHQAPEETPLAERMQTIMKWVAENSGKGIDALWSAVLSAEVTEEEKTAWFHDLHWLLNQGFVTLLENGSIHLSSDSKKKPERKGNAKSNKPAPAAKKAEPTEAKVTEVKETADTEEAKEEKGK